MRPPAGAALFASLVVRTSIDVTEDGERREILLDGAAPGLVGVIPVFDSEEAANAWGDGKYKLIELTHVPKLAS